MSAWKWPLRIGLLLLVLLAAFFTIVPALFEAASNRVDGEPLAEISVEARALHASLDIVDLHADSLLWNRDITRRAARGHVDLPRLKQGNVALQVFSSVTQSPWGLNYESNSADSDSIWLLAIAQLQPTESWHSLVARSLYHARRLDAAIARSNERLLPVRRPGDIEALLARRDGKNVPVGAMLSIEGLHDLEGKIANLDRLYDAGFRIAGLTHFFDNALAGSMHGKAKGGLTRFGRAVVLRMEARGMIVDVAHLSHEGVAELLRMARRPVVSSHGGVQATCGENRNISDDEIRGIAATGGVVGIGYWEGAVCSTDPKAIARAMAHVRDLVGIDHVALGSDFDGTVTTRFDTAGLAHVTQALIDADFTETEIRAAMGGNALRVLRAGIEPMAETTQR